MSFLSNIFGGDKKTATVAKERLKLVLAHERAGRTRNDPEFLPRMKTEIMEVISRYMKIDVGDLSVTMEHGENLDVLEVKIEFPEKDEA